MPEDKMSEEEQVRQALLDHLKDQIAGDKIVDWKDVKRDIKVDETNFRSLNKVDPIKKKGLCIDDVLNRVIGKRPKRYKSQFLEELEYHTEKGKNISVYRDILSALLEYKTRASNICEKVGMTEKEFIKQIDIAIEKTRDNIFETNTIRYEDAQERLADEKGFEELEQLRLEYHNTLEVLALESAVNNQKKLKANTVNLLGLLKGEEDEDGTH